MAKKKNGLLSERMKDNRNFVNNNAYESSMPDGEQYESPKVVINFDNPKKVKKPSVLINTSSSNRNDFASRFKTRQENNTTYSQLSDDNLYSEIERNMYEDDKDKNFVPGDALFMSEDDIKQETQNIKKYTIENQRNSSGKKIKTFFNKKHICMIFCAMLAVVIAVNRVPSLIYNLLDKEPQSETTLTPNSFYKDYPEKMIEKYGDEDWDNDGIKNSLDPQPFNVDSDNDGVIDSDGTSKKINENIILTFGNVVIKSDTNDVGITKFLDYYEINNYKKQWAKFTKESGIPYIYHNYKWEKAEFKNENDGISVYIPYDYCYIEFLNEESKPVTKMNFNGSTFTYSSFIRVPLNAIFTVLYPYKSNSTWDIGCREYTTEYHLKKSNENIVSEAVLADYDLNSDDRYKKMPLNVDDLNDIYKSINENSTALISVQSQKGENLLIAYGYDYLGNLYVCDYQNRELTGVLNVKPSANIISNNDKYIMYSKCEVSGFNISSETGYRFVLVDKK